MFGLSSPRLARTHDQRGFVMSSPLALMSAGAVLLAGVGYFLAAPAKQLEVNLTSTPQQVEPRTNFDRIRTVPVINRSQTYVVVFNNSGIQGLAARTSTQLSDAGWNVVGSDNWYGTIPSSTVYYPESLRTEGRQLARDLRIPRLKPAVDPMQMDRLTVILTGDFRG